MTTLQHINAEDVRHGDGLLIAGRFESVMATARKTKATTLHGMPIVEIRLEGRDEPIRRPALWPAVVQRG